MAPKLVNFTYTPDGQFAAVSRYADLAGSEALLPKHLNEAINYRMLDRQFWT